MRTFVVTLLLLAAPFANGAEDRKYAVLSLIGDRLLIVVHDMQTGSRLDKNQRSFAPLANAYLDNQTAFAMEDAIKAADPGSQVIALSAADPRLFELQKEMLEGDGSTQPLLALLRGLLGEVKATHLVVATKLRHDAMLQMAHSNVGSGTLEGLGFYVDQFFRVKNTSTGEAATGFLAPFAYFRLTLVDLSSWKVVKEERVLASYVTSSVSSKTGHPWEAMTPEGKLAALRGMVRKETMATMPALLH